MDHRLRTIAAALFVAATVAGQAAAQEAAEQPEFPTTSFTDDDPVATVTSGGVAATITLLPPSDPDLGALPVLTVSVDDVKVAEATGAETDFSSPAADASIAEMDPGNDYPEVYFSSYSGGAHCCNTIIVAEQVGDRWVTIPIGDFDGDGNYLTDLNGDGVAEIATIDNRFLYQFDSYAASAAPLVIYSVRAGEVADLTTDTAFLPAHRDWLAQLESQVEPADRWNSPGFLAGWLGAKIRLGEGAAAWDELNANWDFAADEGEEACTTGDAFDDCAPDKVAVLKFPERLRLFLTQNGYTF